LINGDLLATHLDKRISLAALLLCEAAGLRFDSVEDANFMGGDDEEAEFFIVLVEKDDGSKQMLPLAVTESGFALYSWDRQACLGTLSHSDLAELRESLRRG